MIEEIALVVGCDGEFAEVKAEQKSDCSSCGARDACGSAAVAEEMQNKGSTILRALNTIDARPGEHVVIGIEEKVLNEVSMAFYAVPLVSLILCAFLGQLFSQWTGIGSAEPLSALGGLLGLILGLLLLRRFVARTDSDQRYQITILRRADLSPFAVCTK